MLILGTQEAGSAAERRWNNLNTFQDFRTENNSRQGQYLALAGLHVPSSLDSEYFANKKHDSAQHGIAAPGALSPHQSTFDVYIGKSTFDVFTGPLNHQYTLHPNAAPCSLNLKLKPESLFRASALISRESAMSRPEMHTKPHRLTHYFP